LVGPLSLFFFFECENKRQKETTQKSPPKAAKQTENGEVAPPCVCGISPHLAVCSLAGRAQAATDQPTNGKGKNILRK
jgi:hypothetical protein